MSTRNRSYDFRSNETIVGPNGNFNLRRGVYGHVFSNGTNSSYSTEWVPGPYGQNRPYRKRTLILTENPYSSDILAVDTGRVQWSQPLNGLNNIEGSWESFGPYALDTSWSDEDELILLSKLANKIRGHQFNLAVSLAEAHQTFSMIGDTTRKIAGFIHSARKGKVVEACRILGVSTRGVKDAKFNFRRDFSNFWLEVMYGWRPLLMDVKSGAEALAYKHSAHSTSFYVGRKKNLHLRGTVPGLKVLGKATHGVRIKVTLKDELSISAGLGLLDPLSVAWELLPYSFVADWFLPVGNYLETMGVLRSASFSTVVRSEKTEVDVRVNSQQFYGYIVEGSPYTRKSILMKRTINPVGFGSLPPTSLLASTSQLTKLKSYTHAVSGIALLSQRAHFM